MSISRIALSLWYLEACAQSTIKRNSEKYGPWVVMSPVYEYELVHPLTDERMSMYPAKLRGDPSPMQLEELKHRSDGHIVPQRSVANGKVLPRPRFSCIRC